MGGRALVVREVIFRSCDSSACDTLLSLILLQYFFFPASLRAACSHTAKVQINSLQLCPLFISMQKKSKHQTSELHLSFFFPSCIEWSVYIRV